MILVGINDELAQERELIHQTQIGHVLAFDELYRRHVGRIYRYIYFRVDSPATAEDLTADVFLRAFESLPAFEDRSVPLVSWLYRIAHARIVDHYRRTQRNGNIQNFDTVKLDSNDDIDLSLMSDYQSRAVHVALKNLAPDQHQVIVVQFIEGCSLEKTAEILGKTVSAVKALQHRALQNLSKALKRQGFTFENE